MFDSKTKTKTKKGWSLQFMCINKQEKNSFHVWFCCSCLWSQLKENVSFCLSSFLALVFDNHHLTIKTMNRLTSIETKNKQPRTGMQRITVFQKKRKNLRDIEKKRNRIAGCRKSIMFYLLSLLWTSWRRN